MKIILIFYIALTTGALAQDVYPWHLGSLEKEKSAPSAINTSREKNGPHKIVVAVIDSGVIAEHPSLSGQLLPGYDMISPQQNLRGARSSNFSPDARDSRCGQRLISGAFRTHGTEVASLIAANGINGVYGVNTSAYILPIKLFGACSISRRDLLDSIAWAAGIPVEGVVDNPHPAKVINMSISGGATVCGSDLQQLIQRVIEKKIFLVAAAGNNFHKPLSEPANCKGVISVGALDAENKIEIYSAIDSRTTIYAPGGGKRLVTDAYWATNKLMVATYELDLFGNEKSVSIERGVGTSFAAPLVSGFISLWLSHDPQKSPAEFMQELPIYLRDVPHHPKCNECAPRGLTANGKLEKK